MNHVFFFVGAFVLAAGSAGCAIVLLRYVLSHGVLQQR